MATIRLENVSNYEVVISEIPGGCSFKKGQVKEIDEKYLETTMRIYAKFLRLSDKELTKEEALKIEPKKVK